MPSPGRGRPGRSAARSSTSRRASRARRRRAPGRRGRAGRRPRAPGRPRPRSLVAASAVLVGLVVVEHRRVQVGADRDQRPQPGGVLEGEKQPGDRAVAEADDVGAVDADRVEVGDGVVDHPLEGDRTRAVGGAAVTRTLHGVHPVGRRASGRAAPASSRASRSRRGGARAARRRRAARSRPRCRRGRRGAQVLLDVRREGRGRTSRRGSAAGGRRAACPSRGRRRSGSAARRSARSAPR